MRVLYVSLLLIASICVSAVCQDPQPLPRQLWKDSDTSGALGDYLETIFERQLGACLGQNGTPKRLTLSLTKDPKKKKDISAIPPLLLSEGLRQDRKALKVDQSIGRAFAFIYPSRSMDIAVHSPNMYLQGDYLESPDFLLASGFNNVVYDYGCSSSLAASLKANASWSFVPADVSLAIQADVDSNNTYHLLLVSGTFQTDAWKHITASGDSNWQNYARFLVWDWYQNRPEETLVTSDRFLLSQFDGLSIYKLRTSSFSSEGKGSLAAGLGLGSARLDTKLDANYNGKATAHAEAFETLVREHPTQNGREDDDFEALPKPSQLARALTLQTRAHVEGVAQNQTLHRVTQHAQIVRGIPASVCLRDWTVEKQPLVQIPGSLTVRGAEMAGEALPSCRFTITYDLTREPSAGERVSLDYSLLSVLSSPDGTPVATAKIKADSISLSPNGKPSLNPLGGLGQTKALQGGAGGVETYSLDFAAAFPAIEDGAASEKINTVDSDVRDGTFACDINHSISMQGAKATYSTGSLRIDWHYDTDNLEGRPKLDVHQLTVPCSMTGRVQFTLQGGATVLVDLPRTTFLYPGLVAPTAPLLPSIPIAPGPQSGRNNNPAE